MANNNTEIMVPGEMFTRETQEPTAAVYIKMRAGRLAENQVSAVQHLIAASVPKLRPSNISIVDERGALLSRSYENDEQMVAMQQDESRNNLEKRVAQAVTPMVESSLGPGKVRAEVRAEMEFDKVVTAEETFNPDLSVPRSSVTVTENNTSNETQPTDVSVAPGVGETA